MIVDKIDPTYPEDAMDIDTLRPKSAFRIVKKKVTQMSIKCLICQSNDVYVHKDGNKSATCIECQAQNLDCEQINDQLNLSELPFQYQLPIIPMPVPMYVLPIWCHRCNLRPAGIADNGLSRSVCDFCYVNCY